MGGIVMLPLHGTASFLRGFDRTDRPLVLRLRTPQFGPSGHADVALMRDLDEVEDVLAAGFAGAIIIGDTTLDKLPGSNVLPHVMVLPNQFDYLSEGDILGIHGKGGRFRTLYRRNSRHNSFLVTERCNHYCLMCSQPPRDVNDGWILDEIKAALPLVDPETKSLGFTGGEPLLDWQGFISVLDDCKDGLPTTAIHVLSNGRAFANSTVVAAWAGVRHPNLTVGIPIYAAVDHVHDYVVQAQGAFDETVLGILKLKDKGQRVEVRVVLHAITAPRIVETCKWLARNLSVVNHVALMGLENTGFAIANEKELWIDPVDYRAQLAEGVNILASARLNVSVYNLQRCVLDRSVWPYAAQSISDWKNGYIEECERCIEKDRCSGFFTSGRPRLSRGISAVLTS
jgi:His-Xaa-Ser system radical SAM maturase HxsC